MGGIQSLGVERTRYRPKRPDVYRWPSQMPRLPDGIYRVSHRILAAQWGKRNHSVGQHGPILFDMQGQVDTIYLGSKL